MKIGFTSLVLALFAYTAAGAPAAPLDQIAGPSDETWIKRSAAAPLDQVANPSDETWNRRSAAAPLDQVAGPSDETWIKY